MRNSRISAKDGSPRSDAEGEGHDVLPASRVARATELGRLGASLVGNMVRAGARGLIGGLGGRERVWAEANRAGATVLFSSLGRLRGAAAKIGQFLAQRPGTLPDEYLEAMLALTDRVPSMSASIVEAQFLNELGRMPSTVFATFDRRPLAAGSLGQVHAATLRDGTRVAVKVQYPSVDEALESDLANLAMVLPAVERLSDRSDLRGLVDEVKERLTEELDYRREAESYALFRTIFPPTGPIFIPEVRPELSTGRILTIDFVEGSTLEELLARAPSLDERNRAALLLLRFSFVALFDHGVLHVDPNPGNFLFRPDGSLGVVDFGCVKRFPPGFAAQVRDVYRAAAAGEDAAIDRALIASGMLPTVTSPAHRAPLRELARLWARPGLEPDFDFADRSYLDELTHLQHRLARDGAVTIPPDWVFYARQVVGVSYLLYRLGGRHPSLFVEQFARILAGEPLEGKARRVVKKKASKKKA